MCSWYEVGSEFLPKKWPPENTEWLEAERGEYTISEFQLHMCETSMVGKLQHGILNRCGNQAFFNYFHSKVFFLILVRVCFTFRKYVTKIEILRKYLNHCSFYFEYGIYFLFFFVNILKILGGILYFVLRYCCWKKVACANLDNSS